MSKKGIWSIVLLIGTYIACQLIADIGATKAVTLWGLSLSGGTFVFALTFTLRDMIHKRLGVEWARACIFAAAGLNILLSGYLFFIAKLPASTIMYSPAGWDVVFTLVPAITIASILAELISELLDTYIYSKWSVNRPNAPQWTRVLFSNAFSIPVDSLVFCTLAFSIVPWLFGTPTNTIWVAITYAWGGQLVFKFIITLFSLPMIYLTRANTANAEAEEPRKFFDAGGLPIERN